MMRSTSPLPVLPIHVFEDAGVFNRPKRGDSGQELMYYLRVPGIDCTAQYHPEFDTLEVVIGSATHSIIINHDTHQRFFMCDCCLRRRTALVLESGRLVCREEYAKSGQGGSKAIRRVRFTMAVADLRRERPKARLRTAKATSGDSYVQVPIEREIDPQCAKNMYYSTKKAIELGRGAAQEVLYNVYQESDREFWQTHETAPEYVRPTISSLTNAHPRLEINVFRPNLLNCRGELIARTLCWGERAGPHEEALFFVDWRGELPIVTAVHDFTDQARIRWQRLPLAQQASGRFRWTCPVRGENCDVLYLRNRLFASRQAQWLYAPSQRASGRAQKRESGARLPTG